MARTARPTRVVINRQALAELDLAIAEGFEAMAQEALARADVPDAAPFGVGLVQEGGYISYVDGKRIGGTPGVKKPRAMKVRGRGVVVGVGFSFPARFNETGTVSQPARPFLTPAVMAVAPDAARYLAPAVKARLGK